MNGLARRAVRGGSLFVGFALFLIACPDPAPTVCGSVTQCGSASPLADVLVTYQDDGRSATGTTAGDGSYCISVFPSDSGYEVHFEKAGYESDVARIGPQSHGCTAYDRVPDVCLNVVAPAGADGGSDDAGMPDAPGD